MKFRSVFRYFFYGNKSLMRYSLWVTRGHLLFIVVGLCSVSQSILAAQLDLQQLRQQIQQFLEQTYIASGAIKVEITTGSFDARLRLEHCSTQLEYKLLDSTRLGGTVNTQISCTRPGWTVLLPSTAKVYRYLPVSSRQIAAGDTLTEADIKLVETEMTPYRFGFAQTKEQLVGMSMRFEQNANEAFRLSQLVTPNVVKKGDEVTLEAQIGSIRVVSQATAMTDGRIGQQIRVRNNQSQRLVMAKVVAAGKVESIL